MKTTNGKAGTHRSRVGNTPPEAQSIETAPQAVSLCYCYIVECADGTYYTGWTTDTERRVKVHNSGRGARYTSMRRPVKLVYVEPQSDRVAAMKRERAIKRLARARKQALIEGAVQPLPRRKS